MARLAFLLLGLAATAAAFPAIEDGEGANGLEAPQKRVSYSGAQLWKVVLDDNAKRALVWHLKMEEKVQTWGGNSTAVDVLIHPGYAQEIQKLFEDTAISYDVMIDDLQRAIDLENPAIDEEEEELANRKGRMLMPAKLFPLRYRLAWKGLKAPGPDKKYWPSANWGHRMTWSAYHRLSDIHGYLDYLAQTYPTLCSVETIGTSVQGRALKVLKISNGKPGNKAIWVDGGIHAREWISPASVTYMIDQIVENYETESQDVKNMDLYFIPVANPDGYEYSHTVDRLWRKNRAKAGHCTGTDLNRNFGYRWGGKGSSKNPCTETYGGSGGFSEPETAAIRDYILSKGQVFSASISYHSYGQYILYPWGYDRLITPDREDLHRVGQKAAQAMRQIGGASYTVGSAATTLYPAAGGSDDWAKGVAKIKYAYTIELRDTGRYGFILPASFIGTAAKEALAAFRVIAAAARLA